MSRCGLWRSDRLKACSNRTTEASPCGEDVGSGFFAGCLAASRGSTPAEHRQWREGIHAQIRGVMPMQGSLSVERMCRVAAVSRASFYRWLEPSPPVEEEVEVPEAIQAVVLEHRRRYGYRRVTRELRRRGWLVNHKRVARLMSQDNLLAVQPRAPQTDTSTRSYIMWEA
jgi:hypothetical protein